MRLTEKQLSIIQELAEDEWWAQEPNKRRETVVELNQAATTTTLDIFVGRTHVRSHRIFKNGKSREIKGSKS